MRSRSPPQNPLRERSRALEIAAIYVVVSGLWILFSDQFLDLLVADPAALTRFQTLKGWFFVVVTAGLLYVLIHRGEQEAREHLARIARLNRVYAVLSGINSALLRIHDAEDLLEQVCRIAVEQGKFRLARVHRVDSRPGELRVAAQAGATPQEVARLPALPEEEATERALAECVLREGQDVVLNEIAPLRPLGYGSAAAFPLRVEDKVVGMLSLYAPEPNFFDEEEIRLLREMAADTSLGLAYVEKERQLQYIASYDPLTDLPNRTLFEDRLHQAIAQGKREEKQVGILSLSIEELPEINAALGHSTGDHVLQEVARYLTGAVRESDTVARLGSDEFGMVLAGLSEMVEVETIASQISDQAPQMVTMEEQELFLSLRIGAAVYPHDGEAVPTLIQKAALARQAAGPTVGNTVTFFSTELDTEVQERRVIECELRHALEREELELYYQPVVDVRCREIVGAEALIRWHSKSLGELSPAKFIPVAEETGLITSIGEWIVRTACRQGQRWHSRGLRHIRINVNVSVDQLRQEKFVDRISAILEETAFDPSALALGIEITESELMENVEEVVAAILQFKRMGMMIYIDDFGTGYSSLSYLRELPIDTLKIDASFVRDIPGNEDAVAVVKGIIAMAHSLELHVIAEGVETEAQFATLRDLGCDAIQGYLFSRPVPPEELEPLFGKQMGSVNLR